jgi:hypothetical protein
MNIIRKSNLIKLCFSEHRQIWVSLYSIYFKKKMNVWPFNHSLKPLYFANHTKESM